MTKNTLSDLNNHLFEQMERLNDDELNDDQLEKEIKRATAMKDIAQNIIGNAHLIFRAEKLRKEYGEQSKTPKMLE